MSLLASNRTGARPGSGVSHRHFPWLTRIWPPPLWALLAALVLVTRSHADELPVPPVPPYPPPNSDVAPVPNRASAPLQPLSEEPNLNLKLYRSQPPDPSFGFSPGSRYQSSEDRKAIQTPGLSLSVPLR